MLQPLDITNVDKSKHKFMVQSMYPPPGEVKLEEIVSSNLVIVIFVLHGQKEVSCVILNSQQKN